jgi:CBS domain-containing protein
MTHMTVTEFLREKVSLFRGLEDSKIAEIAQTIDQQSFSKGHTVVFRGSSVDGLHIVATGKMGVLAKPAKSHNMVQVAELGPGEVFGEMSILETGLAGATVKCLEDSLVFVVPESAFREAMSRFPEVEQRTRELIATRKALAGAPSSN